MRLFLAALCFIIHHPTTTSTPNPHLDLDLTTTHNLIGNLVFIIFPKVITMLVKESHADVATKADGEGSMSE